MLSSRVLLAAALSVAAPLASHATTILGAASVNLNGVTVTPTNANLYPASGLVSITYTSGTVGSVTSGGTSNLTSYGVTSGATFNGDTFTLGSSNALSISFSSGGMFTSTGAPLVINNSVTPGTGSTQYNLELYIPGTYTDSGISQSADFDLGFTETNAGAAGIVYSGSGTFATPATLTPEPSALALLGTGLVGAAGLIRRRVRS